MVDLTTDWHCDDRFQRHPTRIDKDHRVFIEIMVVMLLLEGECGRAIDEEQHYGA